MRNVAFSSRTGCDTYLDSLLSVRCELGGNANPYDREADDGIGDDGERKGCVRIRYQWKLRVTTIIDVGADCAKMFFSAFCFLDGGRNSEGSNGIQRSCVLCAFTHREKERRRICGPTKTRKMTHRRLVRKSLCGHTAIVA